MTRAVAFEYGEDVTSLEDGTDTATDRIGSVGDRTVDIHLEVVADAFEVVREFPGGDQTLDFRPSP